MKTPRLLSTLFSTATLAALLAPMAYGCNDGTTQSNNDGAGLETEADAGADADTGTAQGPDGGADADAGAPEPTGPVIRTLTTRALLGEMPAENHFLDPLFSSFGTGSTWLPYHPQGDRLVPARRRVEPNTPSQSPMIEVPARTDGSGVLLLGQLLLTRPPLDVSIWVGTPEADEASPFDVTASVLGMDVDDPTDTTGVTLALGPTETIDGITWRRYEGVLSGYAGYGYLLVQATTGGAIYIHAPVAADVQVAPNALIDPSALRGVRRAAKANELRAIGDFQARWWREREAPQIPQRYQQPEWP